MATGSRSVLVRSILAGQAACLLIGLGVSLVPVLPKTDAFWGCHSYWSDRGQNHIQIDKVSPESPASAAGLREGDRVLAIDGRPMDSWSDWEKRTVLVEPGEEMTLQVRRDRQELVIAARGDQPLLAAIMYYDWQTLFAVFCTILLVMLCVTLPLRPLVAMWRPMQMVPSGLGLLAMLVLPDWTEGRVALVQLREVGHVSVPWVRLWICAALAAGFTSISVGDLWCILASRPRRKAFPDKGVPSTSATTDRSDSN